jgi:hypothetical protein
MRNNKTCVKGGQQDSKGSLQFREHIWKETKAKLDPFVSSYEWIVEYFEISSIIHGFQPANFQSRIFRNNEIQVFSDIDCFIFLVKCMK